MRRLPGSARSRALESSGPDRFATVADRWRTLSARAVADAPSDARGGGPVAVGGFALAPDGGASPAWSGFEPASLLVPQVALAREEHAGERRVRLTLAALAQPDDTSDDLLAELTLRLEELVGAAATAARPRAHRSLSGLQRHAARAL